jgi:hypothetical protein
LFKNNDFTLKNADNRLDSCFSILQLSQTGALYSQAFYAKNKTDIAIRPSIPSNRFNLQIIEMSDSIASLHSLADMDVGTMPVLRVKQSQNWHFEKLWDCKCFCFTFKDFIINYLIAFFCSEFKCNFSRYFQGLEMYIIK